MSLPHTTVFCRWTSQVRCSKLCLGQGRTSFPDVTEQLELTEPTKCILKTLVTPPFDYPGQYGPYLVSGAEILMGRPILRYTGWRPQYKRSPASGYGIHLCERVLRNHSARGRRSIGPCWK
jgi:hypothetical protein